MVNTPYAMPILNNHHISGYYVVYGVSESGYGYTDKVKRKAIMLNDSPHITYKKELIRVRGKLKAFTLPIRKFNKKRLVTRGLL